MKKIIFILLLLPVLTFAQGPSSYKHDPSKRVDDFEDIFTPAEEQRLGQLIANFFDTVQIGLATVPTFGDMDKAEFTTELGRQWGVGGKSNNGLMIVISKHDRKMFAATGPGIEHLLTDLQASEIQRDLGVPYFKQGDYFQGTYNILKAYIEELSGRAGKQREVAAELLKKEQEAQEIENQKTWDSIKDFLLNALILILAVGAIIFAVQKIRKKREEKAKYLETLKKRVEIAKSEIKRLVELGKDGAKNNIPEGQQLVDQVLYFGLDPEQEIVSEQGYINYLNKYEVIDTRTQDLQDTVTQKLDLLDNASEYEYRLPDYVSYKSQLNELNKGLRGLVFDKGDYNKYYESANNDITKYKVAKEQLKKDVENKEYTHLDESMYKLKKIVESLESTMTTIRSIIKNDQVKVSTAQNAKSTIQYEINQLKAYLGTEGTKPATNNVVKQKLSALENDLSMFSGDLVNNYGLLSVFLDRLKECDSVKRERQAYLDEQRKIREEAERVERERLRKIREEKEAEERRLRRIREEAEAAERRRNDYYSSSSSWSSSSSSDSSDSGSSFGGGSFSGGGGGSDW